MTDATYAHEHWLKLSTLPVYHLVGDEPVLTDVGNVWLTACGFYISSGAPKTEIVGDGAPLGQVCATCYAVWADWKD